MDNLVHSLYLWIRLRWQTSIQSDKNNYHRPGKFPNSLAQSFLESPIQCDVRLKLYSWILMQFKGINIDYLSLNSMAIYLLIFTIDRRSKQQKKDKIFLAIFFYMQTFSDFIKESHLRNTMWEKVRIWFRILITE